MIRQFLRYGGWVTPILFLFAAVPLYVWANGQDGDVENANAAGWVGLFFAVLAVLVTWIIGRVSATAARIVQRGVPRQGVVDEIIVINGRRHSGHRQMQFRWTGGDGAEHKGRSRLRGRDGFATTPPGTPIRLLEDPANPGRAMWEEDLPKMPR